MSSTTSRRRRRAGVRAVTRPALASALTRPLGPLRPRRAALRCLTTATALLSGFGPAPAQTAVDSASQNGYYMDPALHGDRVVFVAEGDLWAATVTGGVATRLTTHPEEELDPAISPDGRWLAFTGTYEGPREVYVMPVTGGLPRRLTYEGGATVAGWTPDGRVLYATSRYATLPQLHLVSLDPATGIRETIPLADAAEGAWSPESGDLYFTRFAAQGSQTKRYRGGTAQSIWRWGEGESEASAVTADFDGTSRHPMPHAGRIYFVTDRDDHLNLWSMSPDGGDERQLTRHAGWDVLRPSMDGGRIAYQLGGDLRLFDIASGTDRLIPIRLASDFDQSRERWVDAPAEYLDDWSLSGDGGRLALVARGRVFVAPIRAGRLVQATRHQGVRYRTALFLPDDDELLVLSDESGEVEWWRVPASGIGDPTQVTGDGDNVRMGGVVSPDGRRLVHWDHDQRLWLTEVGTGATRQIDFSPKWGYENPVWSPDSRFFAYGRPAPNDMMQLVVYDAEAGGSTPVTTDRFNAYSPAWGPNGEWLYFLSDRRFESLVGSPWGTYQPEPYFTDRTRIYAVALHERAAWPWADPTELDPARPDTTGPPGATNDSTSGRPVPTLRVEPDGIQRRLVQVPIDAGNYSELRIAGEHLYWQSRPIGGRETALVAAAIGPEPEVDTIATDIDGYRVSADGKKLAVRKDDAFHVVDANGRKAELNADSRLDLSGWKFAVVPREDWRQHFVDSWRLERDYFYDPGMHGVDWRGMLEKYLPLLERVRSRAELSDLQAQMAAELAALHTFVGGGDRREDDLDIDVGFLGARLERAEEAGGWRVVHIYRADPDLPDQASPLARWGVDVAEGDIIAAINGVPTLSMPDPHALLRNQVDRQVRLTVLRGSGYRDVIVEPIPAARDADLRYDEWEYTRRLATEEMSDGAIGYVHLRAMGSGNIEEWYREYYPVFDRQGLIIDVRHNRGGNIESWILEKLLRQAWMYWQPRVGAPYWNMTYAFRGHMVVLVDEHTASDGEAFAEGFRRLGLGPVIGARTWGGEIWLTSSNRLADRGIVTAAEFGVYGPEGEWLIENEGVIPDSVVVNRPHQTYLGRDAQLEAAVAYLKRKIEEDPRPVPPAPPYPDKSVGENRRPVAAPNGG